MLVLVAEGGHDYSIWGLVQNADPVVKFVMAGLALASVACWAIIIEKLIRLRGLSRQLGRLEAAAEGNGDIPASSGLARKVLDAAQREAEDGIERGEGRSDLRARLEKSMRGTLRSELQRLEVGLPFLATIGSSAPFIGLFGTVWGIMNSFTAIAQQQDTSLATVAPGIAEALFATAMGLAAAIPAVMAYNAISVSLGRASARAGSAIADLAKVASRPQMESGPRAVVEPLRSGKGH